MPDQVIAVGTLDGNASCPIREFAHLCELAAFHASEVQVTSWPRELSLTCGDTTVRLSVRLEPAYEDGMMPGSVWDKIWINGECCGRSRHDGRDAVMRLYAPVLRIGAALLK